ncbi:MAG: GNAT family N-acetyltransferase [Anaerolineales bacterium]|nr:GNAT family N-acetyltransferase [Anaerolineales bacterium]
MKFDVFRGEKVRLVAMEPDRDAALMNAWRRDSEYARLLDSDPVRLYSTSQTKEWFEKQQKTEAFKGIEFMIRTLEEDQPIGFVGLDGIAWHHGNSWVGIGIGERDYWSKGCGTDAMHIIARYAFEELGLHCLTLNVFAYNQRAIRAYQKVGYKVEGTVREAVHRDGKYWDVIFMGLLRENWQE